MSVRYGVSDASRCGARAVVYQPEGCATCLTLKLGEVQIFEIDFSDEVRCNPRRIGCSVDYDEVVNVISFSATPLTVFGGGGSITASIGDIGNRTGIVQILVDATNISLQPDEKWALNMSVSLESGRILKQCFNVRLIECGEVCLDNSPSCSGPILKSIANCGCGILHLSDEVPVGTVCAEISPACDVFYTLDGTDPHGDSAIPLAAGNTVRIVNNSEINGFRMEAVHDGDEICVSRTYRGS